MEGSEVQIPTQQQNPTMGILTYAQKMCLRPVRKGQGCVSSEHWVKSHHMRMLAAIPYRTCSTPWYLPCRFDHIHRQ